MPPSPNKRRRIVDSEDLAEEQARHPQSHLQDVAGASSANGVHDETVGDNIDQQPEAGQDPDGEEEDPALAEKRRIWDDFQDEYFDGEH